MSVIEINVQTGEKTTRELTEKEKADINAAALADTPTQQQQILDDLALLDKTMPRYAEDIIAVVGIEKFPALVQDRVAQKQALRGLLK